MFRRLTHSRSHTNKNLTHPFSAITAGHSITLPKLFYVLFNVRLYFYMFIGEHSFVIDFACWPHKFDIRQQQKPKKEERMRNKWLCWIDSLSREEWNVFAWFICLEGIVWKWRRFLFPMRYGNFRKLL
jgi:hypothetical protein